jgi:uncharacterized protein YggE
MKHSLMNLGILVLALGLAVSAPAAEQPVAQIHASGEAEVALAPDMATLQLTVAREADTARAALDANSAAMADVIAALQEAGIESRDLQTSGFDIQPRYVYPKPHDQHPPKIVGYTVRNSLSVRVRDLDRLGEILDRSVTLGVNQGGAVRFGNVDPSAALDRARAAAVKDALAKAETLAGAAGVGLGDVLEIAEQSHTPMPRPMHASRAMVMADAEAVPIETGENSYRVSVQVRVAIRQ